MTCSTRSSLETTWGPFQWKARLYELCAHQRRHLKSLMPSGVGYPDRQAGIRISTCSSGKCSDCLLCQAKLLKFCGNFGFLMIFVWFRQSLACKDHKMTCMAFDRSKRCLYTGGEVRMIERVCNLGKHGKIMENL